MRARDGIDLLRRFEREGLDVHGGWAVDALLGTQTRPHDDLDIAIPHAHAETVRGLTARGDEVVREVLEIESDEEADDDEDGDVAAIRRRAVALAERHPERREQLLAFADYQAKASAYIAENLADAIWVLRRSATECSRSPLGSMAGALSVR